MSRTKIEQLEFEKKLSPFFDKSPNGYVCKKCNLILKANYIRHAETCKSDIYKAIGTNAKDNIRYSDLCNWGCGKKSLFFYKNGKAYCSVNANSCPKKIKNDSIKKTGKSRHDLKGRIPYNKGLSKDSDIIKKNIEAIKQGIAKKGHNWKDKNHSIETKKKMSDNLKARYANGWQSTTCGRAKSYFHSSPIAGDMHLTGSWEIILAQALDKSGIKWSKNNKRFDYIKPDGTKATYLPDFYIDELNLYVEVKGYETDLDKAKWSYFREPLKVLRKKEIFEIKKSLHENLDITKIKDLFEMH